MLTPADVAILLIWASGISGYPHPGHEPTLEIRPAAFFERFTAQTCGYYDKGTLFLKEGLSLEASEACVVHELVHFLQDKFGRVYSTCSEKVTREREAYEAQHKFMRLAQHRSSMFSMRAAYCPD